MQKIQAGICVIRNSFYQLTARPHPDAVQLTSNSAQQPLLQAQQELHHYAKCVETFDVQARLLVWTVLDRQQ
jgi:hypothetical protein